jgi:hypothetical protein
METKIQSTVHGSFNGFMHDLNGTLIHGNESLRVHGSFSDMQGSFDERNYHDPYRRHLRTLDNSEHRTPGIVIYNPRLMLDICKC